MINKYICGRSRPWGAFIAALQILTLHVPAPPYEII